MNKNNSTAMIVQQSISPPPLAQDIWLVLHMIRSLMIMSSYISTLTMQYKVAAKEIKGMTYTSPTLNIIYMYCMY